MYFSDENEKKMLWLIVSSALGIRIFFLYWFKSWLIPDGWSFGYEMGRVAQSLATGQGFASPFLEPTGLTALVPPLYPCFLALIFKIFGVYSENAAIAALVTNCMVSALTCIPLYHIGKILFGRNTGYLSAALLALYPISIWYAVNTVWDTAIFTFLCMMLMYCFLILPQQPFNAKTAAMFGLFMGFVALVKTVIIAFYPFALIWLFIRIRLEIKKKIACFVLMGLASATVLMPWMIRNYVLFDRFMIQSNFGLEFMLENNAKSWDAFETTKDSSVFMRQHPTIDFGEFLLYKCLGETNYMNVCLSRTKDFIRKNPGKFLILVLRRTYYFWLGDLGGKNEWTGTLRVSFSLSGLKKILYFAPLPFMIIGIFLALRRKTAVFLPAAYLLCLPAVYYLTHVCSRFRHPLDPIILLFAVYGLYEIGKKAFNSFVLFKKTSSPIFLAIVFIFLTNRNHSYIE